MASRESLNAKRSQALQRHRAATKKVSRLKSQAGVEISGTKFDPRVNPSNLKRYTARQLDAYVAKMDKFVSRGTQFAPGARGAILSGARVQSYNQLQRQLNRDKKAALKQISNIFIPSQGMTIGERVEMSTPKHPVTAAPASYPPHIPFTKSTKGITNEKSLKKLVKQLESDQGGKYFDRKYASQRKAANKMIYGKDGIRNSKLTKDFKDLNETEFSILWNYTNFAEVTATDYVIRKGMMHDKKELAWYDVALDAQLREARARIAEIKTFKLGGRL